MTTSISYLITVPGAAGSTPQLIVTDSFKEMILYVEELNLTSFIVQCITKIDYKNDEIKEKTSDKM